MSLWEFHLQMFQDRISLNKPDLFIKDTIIIILIEFYKTEFARTIDLTRTDILS